MRPTTFNYTARTADGAFVRGAMQAMAPADVVELLRTRALFATAVDPAGEIGERLRQVLRLGAVSPSAMLGFFRSFATLIRAGVPIGRALAVTIDRTADAQLAEALRSILADVEHGSSLSAAMRRRPRDFPRLYVAMIEAGEIGGILDDVLERLAVFLERSSMLSKKVQTALAYPAVVMSAALGLVVFLIVRIVPMFADIFASFNVELPLPTRLLIATANVLAAPIVWVVAIGLVPVGAALLVRYAQTTRGLLTLDRVRLSAPIVGPLLQKAITARIARTLATLLRSGLEVVSAIDAAGPVAGSALYARALDDVNAALRAGRPLAQSLADVRLFDPMFLALVGVGEESGLVDEMLLKVAEYFETDVEASIATLSSVLEPALIIVLGGVVGFIVCSIFIPLYSLIGAVSK